MELDELSFDRLCMEIGQAHEQDRIRDMPRGSVQSVIVLAGR